MSSIAVASDFAEQLRFPPIAEIQTCLEVIYSNKIKGKQQAGSPVRVLSHVSGCSRKALILPEPSGENRWSWRAGQLISTGGCPVFGCPRFSKHSVSEEELRRRIGLSLSKIKHLISVYEFMTEIDGRRPNRWSYYDELLKGRKNDKVKEALAEFIDIIVEKIQSGEIERAVDVRDKLPLITKVGGNTLKKFLSGAMPFDVAVADAKLRGAGNYNHKRLSEFRNWLAEAHLDDEFRQAPEKEKKVLRYELARIERRVKALSQSIALR